MERLKRAFNSAFLPIYTMTEKDGSSGHENSKKHSANCKRTRIEILLHRTRSATHSAIAFATCSR